MSQNEIILNHLKTSKNITSMEAFRKYGITRLSARISDLRRSGLIINTEFVTRKNRYGVKTRFARYTLNN